MVVFLVLLDASSSGRGMAMCRATQSRAIQFQEKIGGPERNETLQANQKLA
jgi:hypothetical protein